MNRQKHSLDSTELPVISPRKRCVLMARDPDSIYAYWDLPQEDIDKLKVEKGDFQFIIRVYDVTRKHFNGANANYSWDIVAGSDKGRHIQVWQDNADYCVEIGACFSENRFIPLMRSNIVRTPPKTISKRNDLIWQDIKFQRESPPYIKQEVKGKSHKTKQAHSGRTYHLTAQNIRDYYMGLFTKVSKRGGSEARSLEDILKGKWKRASLQKVSPILAFPQLLRRIHPGTSMGFMDKQGASEKLQTQTGLQSGASEGRLEARKFFFEVWTELIVHGRTEADAKVWLNQQGVKLNPDGTFAMRFALPDGEIPLKFIAESSDNIEQRHINTGVEREKNGMDKQPKGYLALVLHTHLPFVRHPEENYFLEENWLYEAITETYIPLIRVFEALIRDDVNFRVTMSISPTLAAMFSDSLLQDRYVRHINKLIELAEKEIERTAHDPEYHGLSVMYYNRFIEARDVFINHYQKNLVNAFKKFQESGCLELIACCATHGFLPNLNINESSVRAQIEIGIEQYRHHFGVDPKGMWLPECGFYPGLDTYLKEVGIKYFFCDSHGIMNADPQPQFGVYAPVFTPSGVAAFGRDWESSKQVWSSKEGYPGDPVYREYYRDIGFTSDFDYIKPYIHPDGIRINTGMKYWRITGDTESKEAYHPQRAMDKAAGHAGDFILNRQKQIEDLFPKMQRKPIIVAPYDAELFGHWWFEGPQWIDFLARKIFFDQDTVEMITPSEYLKEYTTNQVSMPSLSSWGDKGFSEFWLEDSNAWIYPHLHEAGRLMKEMAFKDFDLIQGNFGNNPFKSALRYRALNQAARELLLAESSDWPFIIKAGTMVAYAQKRLKLHLNRFYQLFNDLQNGTIDEAWLKELEARDNIFWDLNCVKYYLDTQELTHLVSPRTKSRKPLGKLHQGGRL